MEERLRILKMLEEGKISAEQAARLLEALHGEPKGESFVRGMVKDVMGSVSSVLGTIPTMVKDGVSFGIGERKRSVKVNTKDRVVIKSVGGDLQLALSRGDEVEGEMRSGFVKSASSRNEVVLKTLGGDAKFSIPPVRELRVSLLGGDLSGDVRAPRFSASLMSGDVDLSLEGIEDAKVEASSGDVNLSIPEESKLSLELKTFSGQVGCELPLAEEERNSTSLRGVINAGGGRLYARTFSGDIHVRKRAQKAEKGRKRQKRLKREKGEEE